MRSLLALGVVFTLAGCDLIVNNEDGCLIEAQGRTTFTDSGEPIVGLGVSLAQSGGLGGVLVVDSDRTDSDGRFTLSYDTRRRSGTAVTTTGYTLTVNDEPYDQRYTVYVATVDEARTCSVDLGTVELGPNPLLP